MVTQSSICKNATRYKRASRSLEHYANKHYTYGNVHKTYTKHEQYCNAYAVWNIYINPDCTGNHINTNIVAGHKHYKYKYKKSGQLAAAGQRVPVLQRHSDMMSHNVYFAT
jgi:protein involved in ribonucleotide reduction